MKWKKAILITISILIGIAIVFVLNAFFGNPISKSIAKREVVTYFEDKYNKDFTVYSISYNFLIPDYNIKMGPSDDKDAIFETSRYELTMFDAYGAYLASEELESSILEIITKEYPELTCTVQAEEEHHIEVAGVAFDFFTANPQTRLEKNYFLVQLAWIDTGLHNDEMILLMDEIVLKIHTELKGTPKQLALEVSVKDATDDTDIMQRFYIDGKAIIKK